MDIGTLTGTIELEDELSPLLTKIEGNLEHFAESVAETFGGFSIVAAAAVAVISGVGAAIVGLGEKGSTLNDVEASFDRLAASAGSTGDVLRENLSEGVRGTVGDMELMQSTTRLLSSGMKLTADDAKLMGEASRALGKATGSDAAGGLSILSSALTTGRVRALQAQGVVVDLKGAEERYAKSLGATASELSREGKLHADRIAILEATRTWVERVGVSELSFKEKITQTKVALVEWGESLAKSVASSPHVMAAFDAIKAAVVRAFGGDSQQLLNTIVGWVNKFADAVAQYGPTIIQAIGDIWTGVQNVWTAVKKAWDDVPDWFKNIARDAAVAGIMVGTVSVATKGITGSDILSGLSNLAQIWSVVGTNVTKASTALKEWSLLVAAYKGEAIVAGIQTLGEAFLAFAATPLGVAALLTALGAALYQVGKAFVGLYNTWQEGKSMWDFFTAKQDDNFIRRWLGLSSAVDGAKKATTDLLSPMRMAASHVQDLGKALPPATEGMLNTASASEAAAKKLRETNKAIEEARKQIAGMPPSLQATADATKKIVEPLGELETQLQLAQKSGMAASDMLMEFGDQAVSLGAKAQAADEKVGALTQKMIAMSVVEDVLKSISDTASKLEDAFDAAFDAESLQAFKQEQDDIALKFDMAGEEAKRMGEEIDSALSIGALAKGAHDIVDFTEKIKKVSDVLGDMATSYRHLAQETTGATAAVANFIAASAEEASILLEDVRNLFKAHDALTIIVDAAKLAADSIVALFRAFGGGPSKAEQAGRSLTDTFTSGLASGLTMAEQFEVHAAVAAGASQKWATQMVAVRDAYLAMGKSAADAEQFVNELWAAEKRGPAAVQAVIDRYAALTSATKAAEEAAAKYNLTWSSLDTAHIAQGEKLALDSLMASFDSLISSGHTYSSVIVAMGGDFVDLAKNAVAAGQGIPPALAPIILDLAKMGKITEDNARALLGLSATAVPAFKDVEEAANRYGIKLDELGAKVRELQDQSLADQLAKDFKTLNDAGANSREVLAGMSDDLNQVIRDSAKFGFAIPAELRPLIEQAAQFGLVTDASGQALSDLSQLQWAPPIATATQQLIDQLSGPGGLQGSVDKLHGSLDDLPNIDRTITYHYVSEGGPPSGVDAPGFASGGLVPSYHTAVPPSYFGSGPTGTDTTPAWLTPGEGVISRRGMRAFDALNGGIAPRQNDEALLEMRRLNASIDARLLSIARSNEQLPITLRDAIITSVRK